MYNKLFFIALFLFLSSQGLFSQVTVGSAIKPNEGALLDVKQSTTTDGSANSTKGIGLPRVALTAIDDLSPCADNTSDNKLSHRGLTVYNVTDNSDGAQTLKEGLYFWDGDLWQPSGFKAMQGFGPWHQVDNPTIPSREATTDSYLNAKVVVGGTDVIDDATLSVHDNNGTSSTAAFGTSNAILDLTAANKGFLPPRIALTSVTDTTTIPLTTSDKGMTVYNIGTVMGEGLYSWTGSSWKEFITQLPIASSVNMYYQTSSSLGGQANGANQSNMTELKFSPSGSSDNPVDIYLPETASYAFNVKLYSKIVDQTSLVSITSTYSFKSIFYVGIWVNDILQDISEIFVTTDRTGASSIYNSSNVNNVILGVKGNAGDVVKVKLGYLSTSIPSGSILQSVGLVSSSPRSDRTTLLYWKL